MAFKIAVGIGLISLIFFNILIIISIDSLNYQIKRTNKILERYELFDKPMDFDKIINGVYHTDKYYCVWTEGRTESEINRTNSHEICHDFVKKDNKHFCKGD